MELRKARQFSPLLANVFLHYVLDLWVRRWRDREANGDVVIVRYCDDFIVGFQRHEDAVRFLAELRKRMEQFGLELPEKTRLITFGRYAAERRRERGLKGHPETFNFLGFTHICAKTSQGRVLSSKTRRSSNRAAVLLRIAAVNIGKTQSALGAFYRRLAARTGKAKAVTATARKLAALFYQALRFGMTYTDPGAAYYEERYRRRVIDNLHRRARGLGFALTPLPAAPEGVS
jgi:hypothetical protein